MAKIDPCEIEGACRRIAPHILRTPLVHAAGLSKMLGHAIYLKLETLQETGSFKVRGATNAVLQLSQAERRRGVVTASSGNHGPALAWAAGKFGVRAVVCLSEMVPGNKIQNVRALGGEVRITGKDYDESVQQSLRLAKEDGLVRIHAFDDPRIVAGAGSIGVEIVEDLPGVDTVLVPLSGGGLLAGVATAVKTVRPQARVVGVTMDRGASMYESIKAGQPSQVAEVPSLADALGGNIGLDNRWTFETVRDLVDDIVLVSEDMIALAMRLLFVSQGLVVEGAGAVGIAALLGAAISEPGERCAAIITGRNVDPETFGATVSGLGT